MRGAWPPFHWLQPRIVLPIRNKLRRRPQTGRGGRWQQHMTRPRLTSLPERRIRKHSCRRRRPRSQLSRGRHRQHHRHVRALKDAQTHTKTIPKNPSPLTQTPPTITAVKISPSLSPSDDFSEFGSSTQEKGARWQERSRRGDVLVERWGSGGKPQLGRPTFVAVCVHFVRRCSEARRGEGKGEGGLSY